MKPNPKQLEAQILISGPATFFMLFGGSRSGKTFWFLRNVVKRALSSEGSRHCVLRFRFNHIKSSVIFDTFPKVMDIAFPGVEYNINKTDWYCTLPNGSEIWFGGLDDKNRTEKILGNEYATIYLNECSQISYSAVGIVITRLAQKCFTKNGPLKNRMFFDCNPPNKAHWTYLLFVLKVDPGTKEALSKPENYGSFLMNPKDNEENLGPEYLKILEDLPGHLRSRFFLGLFADANPNAIFNDEDFEKWRVLDGVVPQLLRVVVAVDPSGSGDTDNAHNDAIGIMVVGLGIDGNAYVLQDCTVKAGPSTWGRVVTDAFDRHQADTVVGEINYGGDMVRHTIQVSRPRTPFKAVTSSRGKAVRAEPFSALYEAGKVRHVGYYRPLEDELICFSTVGYTGDRSPNRADALIFALAELFPGITSPAKKIDKSNLIMPSTNYY